MKNNKETKVIMSQIHTGIRGNVYVVRRNKFRGFISKSTNFVIKTCETNYGFPKFHMLINVFHLVFFVLYQFSTFKQLFICLKNFK